MYRNILKDFNIWKSNSSRKPLVIRGGRQVGKTFLIRLFAKEHFNHLVEINFERDPEISTLFASRDPEKIIRLLELQFNIPIKSGSTLLFLDEIQAVPPVLSTLRYFYEEMPDLHVIAAGSLLEFALEEPAFSMPVGRIEYMHLGPLLFEEFLIAAGKDRLADFLNHLSLGEDIPGPIHNQLLGLLKIFLVAGGMPEAVAVYLKNSSWQQCESIKQSLLLTYQDDFSKYKGRVQHQRLVRVFKKLPMLAGQKFKYVNVDRNERSVDLSRALALLCQARVAYKVFHSSSSGVPLGATIDEKKFKALFLDVGLMSTATGLNLLDYEKAEDVMVVNSGSICEQFIGQQLLYSQQSYREPELYYWAREKKNSSAEVDYVIAEGSAIVPIEVKAGKSGTLKSLHMFLREKSLALGVRFNSDIPSLLTLKTTLPDGQNLNYQLLSLPLYLAGQVRRFIRQCIEEG
jgi:predicted AAA+ superfamily ATPase